MRKRLRIRKNVYGYKGLKKTLMMCIVGLSLFSGAMTSYAAGPGEVTQTQTVSTNPVTYDQKSVKALGNWEQQANGTWVFRQFTGEVLTNSWIESVEEAGAYYYVTADGVMLIDSRTPDGYTVDGSGIWRAGSMKTGAKVTEEQQTGARGEGRRDFSYLFDETYMQDVSDHADSLGGTGNARLR